MTAIALLFLLLICLSGLAIILMPVLVCGVLFKFLMPEKKENYILTGQNKLALIKKENL